MSSDDYDPWESDDRSPQDEYDRMTSEAEANDAYHEWKSGDVNKQDNSYRNNQPSGGCFIATAAFGSSLAEEVVCLKFFRDSTLSKYVAGRLFIRNYYVISQPIASYIKDSEYAKAITRLLLKPLITTVKWINSHNQ